MVVHSLDKGVEHVTAWHIAEVWPACRVGIPVRRADHDLGDLAARHVCAWVERAVAVATEDARVERCFDNLIEGTTRRDVAEVRAAGCIRGQARCAHHHFRQLAARRVGARPEGAIGVSADDI